MEEKSLLPLAIKLVGDMKVIENPEDLYVVYSDSEQFDRTISIHGPFTGKGGAEEVDDWISDKMVNLGWLGTFDIVGLEKP